jgi:mRNA interferase RelE/StbE
LRRFSVQLTQSAADDLNRIPDELRGKILSAIQSLCSNRFLSRGNIKKLKGFKAPLYRLRSGDFRIIYQIKDPVVTVMRIIDRKELERILKRLKLG